MKDCGYLMIKLSDKRNVKSYQENWMLYHRYLWEKENGKIPLGSVLIFKDNNPLNCNLDNLMILSREDAAKTKKGGIKMLGNAELTEAFATLIALQNKLTEMEGNK